MTKKINNLTDRLHGDAIQETPETSPRLLPPIGGRDGDGRRSGWTLTIDVPTPSLNEVRRQHWAQTAREKAAMGWRLVGALNRVPAIPRATGARRLIIERHGKRALDLDNLAGGAKSLVDAIKERGLILDDAPGKCELVFRQVVSKKNAPCTVIYLEDVA